MLALLARLLTLWIMVLLGAGVGLLMGRLAEAPMWGVGVGGLAGMTAWAVFDGLRAARLAAWLADHPASASPTASGLWGELGYRIERALRQRERQAESERERLAQFLRGIEASPNGVALLDGNDRIEWCNPVAAAQLGLSVPRDLQQPIINLVRMPAFVHHLRRGDWAEPVTVPSPDGSATLQIMLRPYGAGQKLLLSQDVTERLRTDLMRRDFVANVSHEIRTPLTVLAGFIETMRSLPLQEAERSRMLELMQQQSDRMSALVADLLTLARLEGAARPPTDTWVDLGDLLDRAAAEARGLSNGRHSINVESTVGIQLAGVESELHSAIANLLTNAVRYTPVGGQIEVVWSGGGTGQPGVLTVRDNGIGIPREHLARLTERFYRIDGGRSRESGGTGLGLAIVKHVMQRHDGTLEVLSVPGEGSSFQLGWPALRIRGPAAASGRPDADRPG